VAKLKFTGFLGLLALSNAAHASFGTVLTKTTDWTVYLDKDAMTDKPDCTAIYRDNMRIQLTARSLAISMSGEGGVQSYQFRFDDAPASGTNMASDTEKEIDAFFIRGRDFETLQTAKRFRVQIFTVLSEIRNEDIDLKEMSTVMTTLKGPTCTPS